MDAGDKNIPDVQPRRHRQADVASLSIRQPHTWHHDVSTVPRSFIKQILGLNPFKTSYFALYRPLKDAQYKAILLGGITLAIAAGTPLPIIGVVFGKIINDFPPSEAELQVHLQQLMGVALAYFIVTWGWAVCWGIVGERVSRSLREALVERVLGMELAFFDLKSPDMTSILTEKTQTVQLGTSEKVGLSIQSISYFIAAFTVGFILDARLAGILLVSVIPTMTLIVYFGARTVSRLSRKAAEHSQAAAIIAEGAIRAVQVVQAFGASEALSEDHLKLRRQALRVGIRKTCAGALMLGGVYFVAYAANALAFWEGRRQHERQPDSSGGAGTIYAVVFLILDASFVVGQFGPFLQTFALAASAGQSIFELLDHAESRIDVYSKKGESADIKTFLEDIRFENVTFVYPARPAVRTLSGLNLSIRAGVITGIVGESGSGKSTIAALLMRFYDPCFGRVTIGSKDIREFNLRSWRMKIAVVDQHSMLFSGTILENIKYGLGHASSLSEDEVVGRCIHAAADANCDFLSKLPDGIRTLVGSAENTQLSGGEKQRICLARALVRNPSVLILDEFTSAMDATNEALVMTTLKHYSSRVRCTVLVIAHRLATVKDADRIMALGEGVILEEGTHFSLIEANGRYKALAEAQRLDTSGGSSSECPSDCNTSDATLFNGSDASDAVKITLSEPTDTEKHSMTEIGTLRFLSRCFSLSKPEAPLITFGLFASIVSGVIITGEALIFGNLVRILNDRSGNDDLAKQANFFCLMFFILSLVALLTYSASGSAFGIVSEQLILRLQDLSLRTILAQDMAWFSGPSKSPHSLMARLNMDIGNLSGLSGVILGTLCSVTTSIIGGIVLAHIVAWKIAVVLLAAVPVMMAAGFLRLRMLSKAEERHQSAYSDAAALASEACVAIRTVAALGLEEDVLRRYRQALDEPYKQSLKFTLLGNILLAFSLAVTYFVYALAYWWGSRQVRGGTYTELEFFIVLPAVLFSAQAAGQMFSLAPEITKARKAARSTFDLLDQKSSIISNPVDNSNEPLHCQGKVPVDLSGTEKSPVQRRGRIDFQNVSLTYPSRPCVAALKQPSFSIESGQFAAFVGRSGAGKSSLIALVERFFDPTSGSVSVDGVDVRNIPVQWHRARLSLVEQEPCLFPGSVTSNISLGARPGQAVSQDQVVQTCKMCGLHDFIMSLPEGYSTECGGNGSRLSGGQRQRIAIARALIRDPEILLLDEATSQLDAQTEQEVRKAIAAASSGRTTIMVAHRLASIQNADRIFVFEDGSIVEQGKHDELVAFGGIYAGMVAAQELL